LGSYRASWPGGVPLEQLGDGSQPGMATQTRPVASNAVPHGKLPGTQKSVMLVTASVAPAGAAASHGATRETNGRASSRCSSCPPSHSDVASAHE
jgi:hypothetical protein